MKKVITKNICLDTSFIEAQNFLVGSKVKELEHLYQENLIKIYLTDITYREIISRFNKNLIRTLENVKKPQKLVEDKGRLLKNFSEYEVLFKFPNTDINNLKIRFKNDFDKWILANKVTIISTSHIQIGKVFEDYFENNPPFKEGIKKHEFPDAFALQAIIEYFGAINSRTYLLTLDKDLVAVKSKITYPIVDISALFDLIIRNSPKKKNEHAIKVIENEFLHHKSNLEKEVREFISSNIEEEINSTYSVDELVIDTVNRINVNAIKLETFSLNSLDTDNQTATLQFDISFSFKAEFTAEDRSEAHYDKEDDRWLFAETKDFKIEGSFDVPLTISCQFDLDEEFAEFEVEGLNNGDDLNVFEEFSSYMH